MLELARALPAARRLAAESPHGGEAALRLARALSQANRRGEALPSRGVRRALR